MRKSRLIASGVAVALLAAACQSAPQPPTQIVPAQTDAPDLQPPTEAPVPAQEAEAQAPTSEPVEVRQGLAATDPASVDLANGNPSLVEFFAFW